MKRLLLILFAIFILVSPVQGEFFKDIILTSPTGIWTDSRAYTTLNAAVTAIGALEQDLYIAKEETVTTLVIPANIRLHFVKGGSIANSNTLTINTKNIHADHQIFTGAGAVNFAAGSEVQSIWFVDFETAITQTSNDTVTLTINKADTLLNSAAVGNNVLLKWNTSNLITISAGQTLSNIGNISAPDLRLFVVSGSIAFKNPSPLSAIYASWFGDSAATLDIADNAAAAVGKELRITYAYTIDDNVTLTAPKISINPNIPFAIATTKTLTINGTLDAGLYQIFSCTGTGKVVFGAGAVKEVYPEWWGAVGDGSTDDYTPCQAALTAAENHTCTFTEKKTFATSETLGVPSNCVVKIINHATVKLVRDDKLGRPVFRNADAALPSAWVDGEPTTGFPANENISFVGDDTGTIDGDGLNFYKNQWSDATTFVNDQSGPLGTSDPFYNATAITMVGVKGLTVNGINFYNPAEWCLRFRCCTDISFTGNQVDTGYGSAMTGTGSAANGSNQDGVHFESCNRATITGNRITSLDDRLAISAYWTEGSKDITATGNVLIQNVTLESEAGDGLPLQSASILVGMLGTFSAGNTGVVKNVNVTGNVGRGGNAFRCYTETPVGDGATYGVEGCSISNNSFFDLTESTDFSGSFTRAMVIGTQDCFFNSNKFNNMKRGGYFISDVDGVKISNNTFKGIQVLSDAEYWGSPFYVDAFYGTVKDLTIDGCIAYDSIHGFIYADCVDDNTSSNITISNNKILNFNSGSIDTGTDQYSRAGIFLQNMANAEIRNNFVSGNALGIRTINVLDLAVSHNTVKNCLLGTNGDVHGIQVQNDAPGTSRLRLTNNYITGCGGRGIQANNWSLVELLDNQVILNNQQGTGQSEFLVHMSDNLGAINGSGLAQGNHIIGDGTKSSIGLQVLSGNNNTITGRLKFGRNEFDGLAETSDYSRESGYAGQVEVWLDTVPPIAGNWIQGDRAWLKAAVSGGSPGSIYTATGWKALAALP
jgi:hypothetical protein